MRLVDELAALLGPSGWHTEDTSGYHSDWLKMYAHDPLGVARPKTTEEVAEVMKLANRYGVSVTPQGGNTSLCAGAVPETSSQIILSLSRMNTIGHINGDVDCVTVDAGVVLASLHDAATDQGLIFPMHLGAEGTAQIGGLIATNAGGSHALRYGMMQDLVLGLEVVLPDGQIWDGLRSVLKDNAGYQLRKLFCGAEGTLGIVTRASLRLFPMPKSRATALLVVDDLDALVNAGQFLRRDLSDFISALEFFTDAGLDLALHHLPDLKYPLETRGTAYVLIEVETTSGHVELPDLLEKAIGAAFEDGIFVDGGIAANDAQRAAFWRLREEMPEGQRLEGPQIKHDISVPVACVGTFITQMAPKLDAVLSGLRINPFGHLGDGNIHYNISPPIGNADFGDCKDELSHIIYRAAEEIGGSLAAEHGLGRSKINHADALRSPVERVVIRQIKHALDPSGVMNPGVILQK